jgi:hypothetical protein
MAHMADHSEFKFIAYILTILWHIYSSLINMRSLHILPHMKGPHISIVHCTDIDYCFANFKYVEGYVKISY